MWKKLHDAWCHKESDVEITNFDLKSNKYKSSSGIFCVRQQPRSSFSKWLCTTPTPVDKSILSIRSNKVRRSSSWRSLKERGTNTISSRTLSVDELHRNNKQCHKTKFNDSFHSPIIGLQSHRQKLSNGALNCNRFDRLSSTLVHYTDPNKTTHRRNNRQQNGQQMSSTLSRSSGGGDSGYSEESFGTRSFRRPLHTSCPHCHCERRSSFNNYKKSRQNSSTESSPSDLIVANQERKKSSDIDYYSKENLLSSQSYPHIKPLPKVNTQLQQKPKRTLAEKRRRNLSCDGSLWTRIPAQKPIMMTSSPVFSEPNHHFATIEPSYSHLSTPIPPAPAPENDSNIFGELNLAAIELDSLRTSLSSSSYSSSSSSSYSINNDKHARHSKRTFLVWHEYHNSSLLSTTQGTKIFSVRRGDQVRLLKRIGKSTLLVEKQDDGTIGFLPQTYLAHHQINSFLSLKGLRETVL
ncbi:hypothetical protein I4U23_012014 [Adineta vaga]|nr:hypothetical protein I4U23_012014 [Adineta vaga]